MKSLWKIGLVASFAVLAPAKTFACAACGSGNDQIQSPLADGMNWGILTLLGVLLTVLTCFLVLFVHILRKDEIPVNDPQKPTDA